MSTSLPDTTKVAAPTRSASAAARADSPPLPVVVAVAVVVMLVFGWAFSEFVLTQFRWARGFPSDWGHILAIPLIAGWFVWIDRERLLASPFHPAWFGLVPLLLGLGWYALCVVGPQTLWHNNLRGIGFGLSLFGLVLLLLGWRAMSVLWFPLLYVVVFGQVVSARLMDMVTMKLQDFAALGSWAVLNAIGVDTDRSGNVLTVWSNGVAHPLNIAEACSGMRMLVAFLALGVALAYTGLPRLWQQATLVALGVPVALLVNVLRVVTLGILSLWDVEFAAGDFHNVIGLIWLIPAFLIYLGLLWILRTIVVEETPKSA
jgi:exosortase